MKPDGLTWVPLHGSGSVEGWQGMQECHMEMKLGGSMMIIYGAVTAWRGGSGLSESYHPFSKSSVMLQNSFGIADVPVWGSGRVEGWQEVREKS